MGVDEGPDDILEGVVVDLVEKGGEDFLEFEDEHFLEVGVPVVEALALEDEFGEDVDVVLDFVLELVDVFGVEESLEGVGDHGEEDLRILLVGEFLEVVAEEGEPLALVGDGEGVELLLEGIEGLLEGLLVVVAVLLRVEDDQLVQLEGSVEEGLELEEELKVLGQDGDEPQVVELRLLFLVDQLDQRVQHQLQVLFLAVLEDYRFELEDQLLLQVHRVHDHEVLENLEKRPSVLHRRVQVSQLIYQVLHHLVVQLELHVHRSRVLGGLLLELRRVRNRVEAWSLHHQRYLVHLRLYVVRQYLLHAFHQQGY